MSALQFQRVGAGAMGRGVGGLGGEAGGDGGGVGGGGGGKLDFCVGSSIVQGTNGISTSHALSVSPSGSPQATHSQCHHLDLQKPRTLSVTIWISTSHALSVSPSGSPQATHSQCHHLDLHKPRTFNVTFWISATTIPPAQPNKWNLHHQPQNRLVPPQACPPLRTVYSRVTSELSNANDPTTRWYQQDLHHSHHRYTAPSLRLRHKR